MKVLSAALLMGTVSLASACYVRDPDTPQPAGYAQPAPPPQMTPAAGVTLSHADAAQSLSEAHCNHEAKCNRIGPAARYASWDHCMSVLRTQTDSKFRECRYGIRQSELATCMTEVGGQGCGLITEPLDSFESMYVCRSAALCVN
jgi:hypothetical protein